MPNCKECEHRREHTSVVSYATKYQVCAVVGRTICYKENDLPKTCPRWCPARKPFIKAYEGKFNSQ